MTTYFLIVRLSDWTVLERITAGDELSHNERRAVYDRADAAYKRASSEHGGEAAVGLYTVTRIA
jgi:hypothetical protein